MANNDKTGSMSIMDFFMLGFGSMIGVGWSVAVNEWFAIGGGPLSTFISFLLGTLLMIPIGFCYAELTPAMPVAGGVIAFAYKAFGNFPSFLAGWFVALAYIVILPWEAIYINDVLALIFPWLKSGTPLYSICGVNIFKNGLIIGVIISLIIIVINWVGAKSAIRAQTWLTIVLVITGGLVILFAFLKLNPSNLKPLYENIGRGTHSSLFGGIMAVFAIAPFFLAGFDTITQSAEEGESKISFTNLGKVLVGSIVAAGGFYCLIIISTGMAMPWQEFVKLQRPAIALMFTNIYGKGLLGYLLYWIALCGAVAGLFTTWNGLYIAGARLLVGMSRARLIPKFFSSVHPKYSTPMGANIFCGVASLIGPFVGMGIIDPLTKVGSTAFVIGWFIVAISAIRLRKIEPNMKRPFKMPGGIITAFIAAIISTILIISTFLPKSPGYMGRLAIGIFIGWLALGLCFYLASKSYRNSVSEDERVAALFQIPKK